MANVSHFEGHFQRFGRKLTNKQTILLLSERKEVTPKKPKYFLIALTGNKKQFYISSLYPYDEAGGLFWIEYKGQVYDVTLTEDSAYISLKTTQQRA